MSKKRVPHRAPGDEDAARKQGTRGVLREEEESGEGGDEGMKKELAKERKGRSTKIADHW